MRQIKRLFLTIIVLTFVLIGISVNMRETNASGLVVMKDHNGNEIKYRNSNEKVYQLAEYNYPTNQLRAVWVSAFVSDIPSYKNETQFKEALTKTLDDIKSMGMNAIVYHLRTHNNAMYKSELNPLAKWYSGVNFDEFDPTAWVIEECHKRGIEFHAWLNPYRVSSNGSIPYNTVGEIPAGNPALDKNNLITVGNNIILDPGIPSNRDFIVDTCMEIVENYDVDAIHFDDYFYIDGSEDSATRAKYNTENLSLGDFRRKQVDLFIEDLSNELRAYNEENEKTVQLGISPSGIYRNGSYVASPSYDSNGNLKTPVYSNTSGFSHYDDYLYSDTLNWINNEWIDYIMPQCYWATEHKAASYLELTKWWSWAVRNKKVNFYTGMGIYMALDPSSSSGAYWQYNTDEIEKQLLNAGQYAEFGGACFYKYASLKETSNATIKAAVDLIKNDYWAKRVPAAVQKYYAPLMDEVAPSNVVFDKVTNTITYDAVDNVRGYMVYQVPKGQVLDKNNIDHVVGYIQETSIKVTDTANYDYYVASVNQANETSEAVYVNVSLDAQTVINAINNLPTTITYEHKTQVEGVRKLYELLPNDEKQKVTNLNKLVNAETIINSYSTLVNKLDTYIASLDLHIKVNRVIPVAENITLSYKNQDDKNIYNLTTGEKLKNYLATKYITLIATLNEAGLTLSKEFNINVGYVSSSQTGLFYRNDASCMNPDDEGAYSESDSKYIGWSGHTVVVDNCVLFVADKNYHDITDPSNIDNCNWTSVAGVYVNKTNQTVAMNLSYAFDSHSGNDGYFVISENKIKTVVSGWDDSTSINLQPNEALVIVRYLDRLINGNIMSPVTNLYVGQKAYIDQERELTAEDYALAMIELINTIPAEIKLSDEYTINNIKAQYEALTDDVKVLVTNKDKITIALNQIEVLKNELKNYKRSSISTLLTYLDKTNYSENGQQQIDTYLQQATNSINTATSIESVDLVILQTKELLDDIKTLAEELDDYKIEKINSISSSIKYSNYSEANQNTIKTYIATATETLKTLNTKEAVDDAISKLQQQISSVKTLQDETNELNNYKQQYKEKVDQLVDLYKDITELEKVEIIDIAEGFKKQLDVATSKGDIEYIYSRAAATIKEYFENLDIARNKVETQLNAYINTLTYVEKELQNIKNIASEKISYAKEIAKIAEINKIVENFINEVESLHEQLEKAKLDAKEELNSQISAWYTTKQKEYIKELIENANIDSLGSASEVENVLETTIDAISKYITEIEKAIEDALTHIKSKEDDTNGDIKLLVFSYKTKVSNAKTIDEVNTYLEEFNEKLDEIINGPKECKHTYDNDCDETCNLCNETRTVNHTWVDATFEDPKTCSKCGKTEGEPLDSSIKELIDEAVEVVSETKAKTQKAESAKSEALAKLRKATSVEEINDILNKFNQDMERYNKKTSKCNNSTYMYLNASLVSLALILILRKKRFN